MKTQSCGNDRLKLEVETYRKALAQGNHCRLLRSQGNPRRQPKFRPSRRRLPPTKMKEKGLTARPAQINHHFQRRLGTTQNLWKPQRKIFAKSVEDAIQSVSSAQISLHQHQRLRLKTISKNRMKLFRKLLGMYLTMFISK